MSTEQPTLTEERNERGAPFWRVRGYSPWPTDWQNREHAELHHRVLVGLPSIEGMKVHVARSFRKPTLVSTESVPYWEMTVVIPGDPVQWSHKWTEDADLTRTSAAMTRRAIQHIEGAAQRMASTAQSRDLTRDTDGRELDWPPQYVDLLDGGTVHDWDAIVPANDGETTGQPMTYRELAWELSEQYGGIHDLLDRMRLHLDVEPDVVGPTSVTRTGVTMCEMCGQRPGEIMTNVDGWACWPCYEELPEG